MSTKTLGRYLAKRYLRNFCVLFTALLSIVYLFDMVELLRRAGDNNGVSIILLTQMGLLKMPEVGQALLPFAVMFAGMYTFWQMTQKLELIVMRAAGFSVWQFLMPIIGVALLIGVIQMTIVNPLGSILLGKFQDMEDIYLENKSASEIALFQEGLWLRQDLPDDRGYAIFHASKIEQPSWVFRQITLFNFEIDDSFIERIDAKSAILEDGHWVLRDVTTHASASDVTKIQEFKIPTQLTIQEIEESFASPETMSFWHLPSYIETLEATGFDSARLRVHYHTLLSQPLLFAALILLAASVSMRPPRFRGAFNLIMLGVFISFVVFFLSNFLQALGSSHQIPVFLAAWSPAMICLLLGTSVIMGQEDG